MSDADDIQGGPTGLLPAPEGPFGAASAAPPPGGQGPSPRERRAPLLGQEESAPAQGTSALQTGGRGGHGRVSQQGPGAAPPPARRRRMRKRRLLAIAFGLGALAAVSTAFGVMMAIASELPQLENYQQYRHDLRNSYLYDDRGRPIGVLAAPDNVVLDGFAQISPYMRRAIVAVEDRRFWQEPGVDLHGLLRALVNDVMGGPTEGASTIAEQFVKNALAEQDNRTIFEKLREAVLAYHLTREWPRRKILREYLNSIYFGHGAYGVESAARVYFGRQLGFTAQATAHTPPSACGDANQADPRLPECASKLDPAQAALLAGMVANPSAFDPVAHPAAAAARRDLVLEDMLAERYITRAQFERARREPLPSARDIQLPQEPPAAPYFTSWVTPQIIAALEREGISPKVAAYRAYYGGLKIRTTIDLPLQQAAQNAVDEILPPGPGEPSAALVAIDNRTGEVRAMVSGDGSYNKSPFNLAVDGLRQPGSAFKLFTLTAALMSREYGPDSIIDSRPLDIRVPRAFGGGRFIVHNFGGAYSGPISLAEATAVSDNSVFSQVGIHVGTPRIARLAREMGIRTPVSDNYAMILGGLRTGVSALDMAHAYETIATGGLKVYNPILGDSGQGPIGIHSISCPVCPVHFIANHPSYRRIVPARVAAEVRALLEGPVGPGGTAPQAAIPGVLVAGKTGTTTNYVDAWFVGFTPQLTVAVWVGFPNRSIPMLTQYHGGPVEGGTYPALIWHAFMVQALQILAAEQGGGTGRPPAPPAAPAPIPAATTAAPPAPPGAGASTATGPATTPAPEAAAAAGSSTAPGGAAPTGAGGQPSTGTSTAPPGATGGAAASGGGTGNSSGTSSGVGGTSTSSGTAGTGAEGGGGTSAGAGAAPSSGSPAPNGGAPPGGGTRG
jgi:penicillin-binding protein 1A